MVLWTCYPSSVVSGPTQCRCVVWCGVVWCAACVHVSVCVCVCVCGVVCVRRERQRAHKKRARTHKEGAHARVWGVQWPRRGGGWCDRVVCRGRERTIGWFRRRERVIESWHGGQRGDARPSGQRAEVIKEAVKEAMPGQARFQGIERA